MLAILAPAAVEKHIELEFAPNENTALFIGNPTAISILIRNLVDNAIRYCFEKGRVLVRVYQQKSEVVLEVCDSGPGIPLAFRERVFERFFRVLGNKSPGSGLGLSIVHQICTHHHGRIELDAPTEGTGLIVRIFFPAVS